MTRSQPIPLRPLSDITPIDRNRFFRLRPYALHFIFLRLGL
jgi:hypothetical protein